MNLIMQIWNSIDGYKTHIVVFAIIVLSGFQEYQALGGLDGGALDEKLYTLLISTLKDGFDKSAIGRNGNGGGQ